MWTTLTLLDSIDVVNKQKTFGYLKLLIDKVDMSDKVGIVDHIELTLNHPPQICANPVPYQPLYIQVLKY